LSVLHNNFSSIKLFSDLCLAKFLDTLVKLFFVYVSCAHEKNNFIEVSKNLDTNLKIFGPSK